MAEYISAVDCFTDSLFNNIRCYNPFSLLAEVLYDLDFIIVNIILFWMAKSLLDVNPNQEHLSKALDVKNAIIIPSIMFLIGIIVAFLGFLPKISERKRVALQRETLFKKFSESFLQSGEKIKFSLKISELTFVIVSLSLTTTTCFDIA